MAFFGLYRRRYGADWADELVDVGKALSIACVVVMASTFVLYLRAYSRVVIVSFWPISIIAVTGLRVLMRRATAAAWASGFGARRVLVLGSAGSRAGIATMLRPAGNSHLELVGPPDGITEALREGDTSAAGALSGFVDEQRITDVVCVLEDVAEESVASVIWPLSRRGIRVRLFTKAARVLTSRSAIEEMGAIGLVAVDEKSGCPADSVAKRAFDLVIAVPGSLVLSLYVGVAWLAARFGGSKPLLVRKALVGKGGHQFQAAFPAQSELSDGLPIRARARLMLLFNIVRGRLSFVGPRPLTPEIWRDANQTWRGIREQLVPGLVGSWSLLGGRSANEGELEAMDLQYLREWSLGLDVKIIIRTLAGRISPAYVEKGL
jgi:putative colanic acid biosynthesis UDP-glucose lipid carrier transferase